MALLSVFLSSSFSLSFYLCVHPNACRVPTHVRKPEEGIRCPLSHLSSLRQGLSLILELGWQPASPSAPPVPSPHSTRVIGVHVAGLTFLRGCWEFKLGSLCLLARPLTHWVLSPAPDLSFLN